MTYLNANEMHSCNHMLRKLSRKLSRVVDHMGETTAQTEVHMDVPQLTWLRFGLILQVWPEEKLYLSLAVRPHAEHQQSET